jgi:peroxiredoxin
MPSVQRAQQEYQKSGIPVVAISLDGDGAKSVKPFLAEHKYTLPVPLDPEMQFARSLGVRVTPWTVIIDRDGNLVGGGYGRIDMLSPEFRNYIKALSARAPG